MANGIKLSSVVGGGSVGFKHNIPTVDYEITLPNENIAMPMMRLSTAKASTSGTFIDFTDVPAWAKKITVMFNGVSTNGAGNIDIRIGAGTVEATGYNSTSFYASSTAVNNLSSTTGFMMSQIVAGATISGAFDLSLFGNNIWIAKGQAKVSTTQTTTTIGDKALSGALSVIRIATANGTDLFDAGSINVLYEGY